MPTDLDLSRFSPSECILLAQQLWDRARARPEVFPVTDAQRDELKRRIDALDSGEMTPGQPWESVRERLFRR